jgi:hypothetical protein
MLHKHILNKYVPTYKTYVVYLESSRAQTEFIKRLRTKLRITIITET